MTKRRSLHSACLMWILFAGCSEERVQHNRIVTSSSTGNDIQRTPVEFAKPGAPRGQEVQQGAVDAQNTHGFGLGLTAKEIPSALDPNSLPKELITPEEAKQLMSSPAPSTLYSGDALAIDRCSSLESFGGTPEEAASTKESIPNGAMHLGQIWTQDYLLNLFDPSKRWFKTAMMSLEEYDPEGRYRPTSPTHPYLVKRLGKAINPGAPYYVLQAISFRVADRVAASANLDPEGKPPVLLQIKIAYGLNEDAAESSKSLAAVNLIHSIAVRPEWYDRFVLDLLRIPQDPALSGCHIARMLNRYIRGSPATVLDLPPGSYFFLHANIFDQFQTSTFSVGEWRWTELKPVSGDTPEVLRPEVDSDSVTIGDAGKDAAGNLNWFGKINDMSVVEQEVYNKERRGCLLGKWILYKSDQPEHKSELSELEAKAAVDCPREPTEEQRSTCLSEAAAASCESAFKQRRFLASRVHDTFENLPQTGLVLRTGETADPNIFLPKTLRLVAMNIVPSQIESESSTKITPRHDLAYTRFFTGSISSCGRDQLPENHPMRFGEGFNGNTFEDSKKITCQLLVNADGSRVRSDHPAYIHEEAWDCAGCHMRLVGLHLASPVVNPPSGTPTVTPSAAPELPRLEAIASMNKQHIGFGDGGNRRCFEMFSVPRPGNRVALSSYFLEFSNGYHMNGYSPVAVNSVPKKEDTFQTTLGMQGENSSPGPIPIINSRGIDSFRCSDPHWPFDSELP